MGNFRKLWLIIKLSPILLYRKFISPLLPAHCRFYPTCSEYATDAIKQYNFLTASLLILVRLLKCHPLHSGGYNPVPNEFNVKTLLKKSCCRKKKSTSDKIERVNYGL